MDALWLTVLRRHAKDKKGATMRRSWCAEDLKVRVSHCEVFHSGCRQQQKTFSWSNPVLITEAWLWITQPLKLSEKSFTTSLSVWSVTNPWRKHFSVVKRSSSRKGSISLSVRYFIREACHSWAMERKMLIFSNNMTCLIGFCFCFVFLNRPKEFIYFLQL